MYRSYFAFKDKHLSVEKDGETIITSAIFGFVREIIKLYSLYNYDFIISALDAPPYIKKDKYPFYKERPQRGLPSFAEEKELIKAILTDLYIPCLYYPGYEAEDAMAFILQKLDEHDETNIYTSDEDCYALLSKNTSLISMKVENKTRPYHSFFTEEDLMDKYGVTPKQFRVFKAITGCKSDRVPGVPGLGEKKAYWLVNRFKTFKKIKENIKTIIKENPGIGNKLSKSISNGELRVSRYLTKIEPPEKLLLLAQKEKVSYEKILEYLEAETLIEGSNRLFLKKIREKQIKSFLTVERKILWERK
jgi:DNA polymerase-1